MTASLVGREPWYDVDRDAAMDVPADEHFRLSLGQALRNAREAAGLSRQELDRLSGVRAWRIQMLERGGIGDADFGRVRKLAAAVSLKVSLVRHVAERASEVADGSAASASVLHVDQLRQLVHGAISHVCAVAPDRTDIRDALLEIHAKLPQWAGT